MILPGWNPRIVVLFPTMPTLGNKTRGSHQTLTLVLIQNSQTTVVVPAVLWLLYCVTQSAP